WVVLGSVAFLLLVACANVANLFMVRAESARKPTAVRAALGASGWRIAWSVLAETLSLTAVGTALGALLAWGALAWVTSRGVADLPRLDEVAMGGTTLAVAVGLALMVGTVLALLPILRLRATAVADGLRRDGRTTTGGRESTWSRDVLVSLQLAAALVLVVGSGLLFRSFTRLQAVDPGFDPDNVTIAGVSRSASEDPERALAAHRVLMERLEGLPGIDQVAMTSGLPFIEGNANGGSFDIESRPTPDDALPPVAMNKSISTGYFELMDMPVLAGRTMQRGDGDDGRPVLWVNQTFADRFLDGQAVGERVRDDDEGEWGEIVGVVGDVHEFGLNAEVRPMMYVPAGLHDWGPNLGVARVVL
ncbi:MAG: ABC transporter permease, partial [Gemmatimonadetes bacterium]|nr:ABC transporter permease [Gemmatimonadota bacterium]